MIFFVISGKILFLFSRKYDFFFLRQKMKDDLSKMIHGNMVFSVYMYKCYKYDITILPKKQRQSSPKKIHLKVTFPASLKMMIFMVFLLKTWYSC